MAKSNNIPQIQNEEQYEALVDKGYSKEKAARIANTKDAGKKAVKLLPMKKELKKSFMTKLKKLVLTDVPK